MVWIRIWKRSVSYYKAGIQTSVLSNDPLMQFPCTFSTTCSFQKDTHVQYISILQTSPFIIRQVKIEASNLQVSKNAPRFFLWNTFGVKTQATLMRLDGEKRETFLRRAVPTNLKQTRVQTARSLWAERRWSVCGAELCGSVPHDRNNWWNTTRQLEHISIKTLSLITLHLIVCRMGLVSEIKSMRINIPPLSLEVGQKWLQIVARAIRRPPKSSQMKHLCQLPPNYTWVSCGKTEMNEASFKKIWQLPLYTPSQKANIFPYKLGSPYENAACVIWSPFWRASHGFSWLYHKPKEGFFCDSVHVKLSARASPPQRRIWRYLWLFVRYWSLASLKPLQKGEERRKAGKKDLREKKEQPSSLAEASERYEENEPKIPTPRVFISQMPTSHIVIIASISIRSSEGKSIWLPGRRSQNKSVYRFQLLLPCSWFENGVEFTLRPGRFRRGLMNYKHIRWIWQNNGIQQQNRCLLAAYHFEGNRNTSVNSGMCQHCRNERGLLNWLRCRTLTSYQTAVSYCQSEYFLLLCIWNLIKTER